MTDLVPVQRPDNHLHRLLATFIEGKRAGSPHTADAYHRDPGQRVCHFQRSGTGTQSDREPVRASGLWPEFRPNQTK